MSAPVNPPAFPLLEAGPHCNEGMTMRDWFAAQALAGLCANAEMLKQMPATLRATRKFKDIDEAYSDMAWKYADAMLAEREKRDA